MTNQTEILSTIAEYVGQIHVNLFLLIDGVFDRSPEQIEAIEQTIKSLADWEIKALHNLRNALEGKPE